MLKKKKVGGCLGRLVLLLWMWKEKVGIDMVKLLMKVLLRGFLLMGLGGMRIEV